jgi:hypothetical protein
VIAREDHVLFANPLAADLGLDHFPPSLTLSKQLCGQDLRVAQARAGLLVAVHSSVRERLGPPYHSRLHAEPSALSR